MLWAAVMAAEAAARLESGGGAFPAASPLRAVAPAFAIFPNRSASTPHLVHTHSHTYMLSRDYSSAAECLPSC